MCSGASVQVSFLFPCVFSSCFFLMARSSWKGPYIHPSLLEITTSDSYTMKKAMGKQRPLHVMDRATTILPCFVGGIFNVYTGKHYIAVKISEPMVGHKLGEYANTRKPGLHPKRSKKQLKK